MVIGAGISGCSLAWELYFRGKTVILANQYSENSSSNVAAGLINPLIPRSPRKTWMAETLQKTVLPFYSKIETQIQEQFYFPQEIFQLFHNENQELEYEKATKNDIADIASMQHFHLGNRKIKCARIETGGRLNVQNYISKTIAFFRNQNCFLNRAIDNSDIKKTNSGFVVNNIEFDALIFCCGIQDKNNRYFPEVQFNPCSGDILTVEIKSLQLQSIVKKKYWIIPTEKTHEYLVGSTFHLSSENLELHTKDAEKIIAGIEEFMDGNKLKLIHHKKAVRPTVLDRKPYLGESKIESNVYILNGLGSKGSSLITWLAPLLVDNIIENKPLPFDVDIERLRK